MGFLLRAAFWLAVVALFLPPEERPIPLPSLGSLKAVQLYAPDLSDTPPPELCPGGDADCLALLDLIDRGVAHGVQGLEALEAQLAAARAAPARP